MADLSFLPDQAEDLSFLPDKKQDTSFLPDKVQSDIPQLSQSKKPFTPYTPEEQKRSEDAYNQYALKRNQRPFQGMSAFAQGVLPIAPKDSISPGLEEAHPFANIAGKLTGYAALGAMTAGIAPALTSKLATITPALPFLAKALPRAAQRSALWGGKEAIDQIASMISGEKPSAGMIGKVAGETAFGAGSGLVSGVARNSLRLLGQGIYRGAWTTAKELMKDGVIDAGDLLNIGLNSVVAVAVEAINAKQVTRAFKKQHTEGWRKALDLNKIMARNPKYSKVHAKKVLSLMGSLDRSIKPPVIEQVLKHMPEHLKGKITVPQSANFAKVFSGKLLIGENVESAVKLALAAIVDDIQIKQDVVTNKAPEVAGTETVAPEVTPDGIEVVTESLAGTETPAQGVQPAGTEDLSFLPDQFPGVVEAQGGENLEAQAQAKKFKTAEEFIKNVDREKLEVFKQEMIDKGEDISLSGSTLPKAEWREKIFIPKLTDIWNKANPSKAQELFNPAGTEAVSSLYDPLDVQKAVEAAELVSYFEPSQGIMDEDRNYSIISGGFPDPLSNKGYSTAGIDAVIKNIKANKPLTEKQQALYDDLLALANRAGIGSALSEPEISGEETGPIAFSSIEDPDGIESVSISKKLNKNNLTTPDGTVITPEEQAITDAKISKAVQTAETFDQAPPTDAVSEEPELPILAKLNGFTDAMKYWVGTKEERWQVGIGAIKGRQIFEMIRYYERAVALINSLTEKRNKKIFFKVSENDKRELFAVLKGIQGVDENGIVEFGALQPAGDYTVSKSEGKDITYEPGEELRDGRIIGREVKKNTYATYRVYNTQSRYSKLIAKDPKTKDIIAQYFALNEELEHTILGVDLPAFATQVMHNQFNIKSMHPDAYTYVPGVLAEQRFMSKLKNLFKSYTASGRYRKTGRSAELGLEETDIQKAYTIKQQDFTKEFLLNDMIGNVLSIVLEPIDGEVKHGYTKININHPRIAAITEAKAELFSANGIDVENMSMYQYPSILDKEFDINDKAPLMFGNKATQRGAEILKDTYNGFSRIVTTNYLIKPSTANRNFVSGFEQYMMKPMVHFYEGMLGGGFTAVGQDLSALLKALSPAVQRAIPDELLGGVFVSDLYNKKSIFHYPLMPFRAIEFFFKRSSVVADLNTKMITDFRRKKKSGEISKNTPYKQYKEENMEAMFREMFQTISDNADSYTYDYWNKPKFLEMLPKAMVPFPNYAYHKARFYIEHSPLALFGVGKKNHSQSFGGKNFGFEEKGFKAKVSLSEMRTRIAKALAGATILAIATKVANDTGEIRDKQLEDLSLKRIDWKFDTSGRIKFYGDDEVSLFVRAYDQPYIGDVLYMREILMGRSDITALFSDMLSLGPALKLPALLIGLRSDYEKYRPMASLIGEQVAGYIPFGAYMNLMRIQVDPKKRKTYSQDYGMFRNFVDPITNVIPYASKILPPRIPNKGPDKGEIRKYNISEEYIKMFFLNIKRIDNKEYEDYFNNELYGGAAGKRLKKLNSKEAEKMLDDYKYDNK